ncbi:four helix bundle protein [Ulvibacter antarcticus]|uniref:Four helix bundle protein n=1 Tax=Ulvibacter antarcticus TaxID=442714 RepID=A0A3L9YBB7_9FLAO|nr:four helix bundle protein [Ulvibacter antarcticus]RMA57644.1 four helix bundle protein [Ulvibacter antarcticus]
MKSTYYFKFEDLKIYQKAITFGESVNGQINIFPKEETYRLASQFIRAADSIANNIAEGSASSDANFNRYLQIAWDSAHECVVCSTKARLRGFISIEQDEHNRENITELSKMISSYKKYLKTKLNK